MLLHTYHIVRYPFDGMLMLIFPWFSWKHLRSGALALFICVLSCSTFCLESTW